MRSEIIITSMLSIFIVVMLSLTVSGQVEDSIMTTKKSAYTDYPILEFKDKSNNKLADVEILKNTDQCLIECETLGKITLYKDDKIFNQFEFVDKKNVKKNLAYQLYIEIDQHYTEDQAVMDEVCGIDENLTTSCHYVQVDTITVQKTRKVWQQYDGKKLSAGTYRWKMLATKDRMDSIDWSFTYQGIGFDEVRKHYVWWNGSWDVKAEIKIEERSGSTINNYTADITIPYNSLMRTDYQDIRFLNQSQTGELGYWMYFSNSSEARFRVRIPTNLLPNQNNTVWLYYRNPTATTTSDIANAHIIGEDGADFSEWTEVDVGAAITLNTVSRRVTFILPRETGYSLYRAMPPFENYSYSYVSSMTATTGGYAATGLSNATENPITLNGLKGTSYSTLWRTTAFNFYGYGGTTVFFNDNSADYTASNLYHTKVTRYGNTFNATTYNNAYVTPIRRYGGISTGISKNINVSIMLTSLDEAGAITITGYLTNYSVFKYIYPEPLIVIGGPVYQNISIDTGQTYNLTTYETQREGFILNLSYNSSAFSSISATLIYNGTSYTSTKSGSGDNLIFTRSIDIPVISSATNSINLSFYWNIILTNASGVNYWNMTARNQTVSRLIFTKCNVTYSTPISINYSIVDEETLLPTNATFESTFYYNIAGSSISKNYSYTSPNDDNSSYHFCANINATFNVDAVIKLNYAGYNEKTYYLNDEQYFWSNKTLYLLPNNNGTDIIVDLKDQGLNSLEGYYIKFDRYYPSTNSYLTVIEDKTDALGQIVAKLIENVVRYKIRIYDPDNVLVKTITNPDLIIACKSTICVQQIVVEDTTDDFDRFNNITDLTRSLTFNKATNTFTASWTDLTGQSATYRLQVYKISFNGSTLVSGCNESKTLATSSITCTVPSSGNYHAQFFRKVNGDEIRIDILNIKVGEVFKNYSREGLLWVLLILLTLVGVGSFDPNVGIGLYMVGFILLGLAGLVSFSWIVFIANTLLCCVFFWAFNR